MKTTVQDLQLIQTWQGASVVIPLSSSEAEEVAELKKKADDGKPLQFELKIIRKQRSLDANAALWFLLQEMAVKLRTNKDALYLEMLGRYGVFTHIIAKANAAERFKAQWRTVKDLGEVTVNGQTGKQLQCYFGSSTYNTLEFSRLLDGTINDAKEIGINLISDADRALMLAEWGK